MRNLEKQILSTEPKLSQQGVPRLLLVPQSPRFAKFQYFERAECIALTLVEGCVGEKLEKANSLDRTQTFAARGA